MATYKIIAPNEKDIVTLEDWYENAPPFRPELHWKDGKSAKELAKYILFNDGINMLLEDLMISYNGKLLCYPEHITKLPGIGNGRNHDLLIVSENDDLLIGVEAKTDESLGVYCKDIKNPSENKKRRIEAMAEIISDNKEFDCQEFRYQLLTAAAGTILEAKRHRSKRVYFVVLTFEKKGYIYNLAQTRQNKEDFDNFSKALSPVNPELKLLYLHKNLG